MKTKISQKQAIELINKNLFNSECCVVEFNNELLSPSEVILLGKNGIEVPENLIFYNDNNIDFCDIPEISEEDIETGKIQWVINAEFPVDYETQKWIKQQNIDINKLLPELLRNFYHTMKILQKNAAFL